MSETPAPPRRLSAPRPPESPPPFRLPLLASLAPLVVAVVLWAITGSPFALLFAVLGPVTALASFADSRLGARRTGRREEKRFAHDVAALLAQIEERHAAERAELAESHPAAEAIAVRSGADPYRWKGSAASPVLVNLGIGSVSSALQVEGGADETIRARAATVHDAPVLVDARLGIGVCGPPILAAAVGRSIAVQLAWALSPATFARAASEPEGWVEALPHAVANARAGFLMEFVGADGSVRADGPVAGVAIAAAEELLPGGCRVVIQLRKGCPAAIVQHPDRNQRREFRVGVVSRERALSWARRASEDAARDGLVLAQHRLPEAVELAPLLRAADPATRASLACEVAVSAASRVTLDLVADGPHAVIGGTTGSGKSELLISWVLAMGAAHPPERVTFLLIDFKGGSAFAGLAALPHTVGIVTDLDQAQAARALASLKAELRFRERALAEAGVRGIDDLNDLPRLVIVVDEFAAMLGDHPDLHALFADIAARGRSLGVHLVLCTQRPAGVVRDAVLANADLRICMRVNNRADSSALVGTDAAATLPVQARGRGILTTAGAEPRVVQFALAAADDIGAIAARWTDSPPPRRPWCEPLPDHVGAELLGVLPPAADGIPFGLVDLPQQQRRDVAVWKPNADGHLLVLGAPGSGKSTALRALGAELLPADSAAAWDAVTDLVGDLEAEPHERLVAIDDLDSLVSRFAPDYREAFVERLGRVLRDGAGRGIHVVLAAQRLTAEVQVLANLVPRRLLLRHASRQDLLLAGGDGAQFLEGLPPGGALWRGDRVQVLFMPPVTPLQTAPKVDEAPTGSIAIVSSRPAALVTRLGAVELASVADPRELLGAAVPTILVGDVDEWQSRWGALAAVRQVADIVFEGCSLADYRALTRSRELPPPLAGLRDVCWLLTPDGTASRTRLPERTTEG